MEIWHILNRGVEKRNIVADEKDRVRFVHDLFVFNDANIVEHISKRERRGEKSRARSLLVYIHAFCLMDNHYHFLLSEASEGGISKFMQKFNMGYTKYFNERHQRSGALWQGKHKKILIKRDAHFMYTPYYIHLNPLDFSMPEWRRGGVRDTKKALLHLRNYRWSSHLDYLGIKNFPSVITRNEIGGILGSSAGYEREIVNLISGKSSAGDSLTIER